MRRAPCPVVVVPAHIPRHQFRLPGTRALMCALDETTRAPDAAWLGTRLAARCGGCLHAVHTADPDESVRRAQKMLPDLLVVPADQAHLAVQACCPVTVLPPTARQAAGSGRFVLSERVA